MSTNRSWAFAPVLMAALLGGCAHSFDIAIPQADYQTFKACMKDTASSWRPTAPPPAAAAMLAGKYSPTPRDPKPGVAPSFRNLYLDMANSDVAMSSKLAKDLRGKEGDASPATLASAARSVERVRAVLDHRVFAKAALMTQVLAEPVSAADVKASFEFSADEVTEFMRMAADTVRLDDWSHFTTSAVYTLMSAEHATDDHVHDVGKGIFVEAYLRAYFRNGSFVTATSEIDIADLDQEFPLLKELPKAERKKLEEILKQTGNRLSFGKVAEDAFVSRGGTKMQIPPITLTFNPVKRAVDISTVDYLAIGSDLVRIIVEAVFDANLRLPAVSAATGVKLDVGRPVPDVLKLADFATIVTEVTKDDFGEIEQVANKVDGSTSALGGRLIRGIGPVALNNESIAKLLEALMGVVSRKATEKVAWCWHASREHGQPMRADAIAPLYSLLQPAGESRIRVTVRY